MSQVASLLLAVVSPSVEAVKDYIDGAPSPDLNRCLDRCLFRYHSCISPCNMMSSRPPLVPIVCSVASDTNPHTYACMYGRTHGRSSTHAHTHRCAHALAHAYTHTSYITQSHIYTNARTHAHTKPLSHIHIRTRFTCISHFKQTYI